MALPCQWTTLTSAQIQHYLDHPPLRWPGSVSLTDSLTLHSLTFHIYDQLASTNQTLWELMRQGATAGTVAIARQQSAGKGQWGRQWQSSLGGLYLSAALEPQLPVQNSPHLILSTVCGVALALRACQLPVSIKWPNDLVVEVPSSSQSPAQLYKVGGILTETRIQGQTIGQAIVGIGLNGANCVPEPGITLVDLWSQLQGNQPLPQPLPQPLASLNGLAAIAIHGIYSGWQRLQMEGIDAILRDYNHLFIHRDRILNIEWEGRWQWIQILNIDASGYLRVRPTLKPGDPTDGDGTSSLLQASREEIQIPPGTIQLGYCTS